MVFKIDTNALVEFTVLSEIIDHCLFRIHGSVFSPPDSGSRCPLGRIDLMNDVFDEHRYPEGH